MTPTRKSIVPICFLWKQTYYHSSFHEKKYISAKSNKLFQISPFLFGLGGAHLLHIHFACTSFSGSLNIFYILIAYWKKKKKKKKFTPKKKKKLYREFGGNVNGEKHNL